MSIEPNTNTFATDGNGVPAMGGVAQAGTDRLTLELAPGSSPGRGQLAIGGGTGFEALTPIGAGIFTVPTVTETVVPFPAGTKAVQIKNDDGAEVANGSAGVVYYGPLGAAVFPLRVGESTGLDADGLYFVANGAGRKLAWVAFG